MNIREIVDALSTMRLLRGVTFDWKDTGKHDIGLIAEEVAEVVPEVVAYEENGVDVKGLDYARLVTLTIQAIKEQQQLLEKQHSEIEELKAAVKILASRQPAIAAMQ